jgi:hypothetical protein
MIQLAIKESAIDRARTALAGIPGATVKALSTTLNKAIAGAKTDASRKATEIYHVKKNEVLRAILVSRSKPGDVLQASFKAKGYRKSLAEYKLTPSSGNNGKADVRAAVKKEGGMKPIPKAYIAEGSGGYAAYIEGKRLTSPAIPQLLYNEEVSAFVQEQSASRVEKALDHEILRLLGAFK